MAQRSTSTRSVSWHAVSARSATLRARPAVSAVEQWIRGVLERMVEVRVVETSIVLAAQAFLALFPLVIVLAAILPQGTSSGLLLDLRSRFGLSGQSADALQKVLVDRGSVQQSLSVISFILVIASATAFTRALQRLYERAWGLPKIGVRGVWRWIAWLAGLSAYLALVGTAAHHLKTGVVTPTASVLGLLLWWWTPFLLLGGRVRWRALLPAAVIITITQFVVTIVSTIVMPRTVRSSEANYGSIGVVFAIESWFIVLAGVLVVGSTLGASIGTSHTHVGARVRGTLDPEGWRRDPIHRYPRKKARPTAQPRAVVSRRAVRDAARRPTNAAPSTSLEPSLGLSPSPGPQPSSGPEPSHGLDPPMGMKPPMDMKPPAGGDPSSGLESSNGLRTRDRSTSADGG
jgi:membrane protein